MRRFAFVLAILLAVASGARPCSAGILDCILISIRAESASPDGDPHLAELYYFLHSERSPLGGSAKLQDQAFRLFSDHGSPWNVVNQFYGWDPILLERAFTKLEKMPMTMRAEILQDPDQTALFLAEFKSDPGSIQNPIEYDGVTYEKKSLERARDIQVLLEKQGVRTRLLTGATYSGFSKGQALIQILRVEGTPSKDAIRSGKKILKSAELNTYLTRAEDEQGAIVVDPSLSPTDPMGYFSELRNRIPGKNWMLAIQPDASWSVFVHEWTHKTDFIDHEGKHPGAVFNSERVLPAGIPRALDRAGRDLEKSFTSELNATGAQLHLYFQSTSDWPLGFISTLFYRAKNQRKIAIGRILQDPTNPEHYVMYLGSRVVFYGTAYALGHSANYLETVITDDLRRAKAAALRHEWVSLGCEKLTREWEKPCDPVQGCWDTPQERTYSECRDLGREIGTLK